MPKLNNVLAAFVVAMATGVAGSALAAQEITTNGPVKVVVNYSDLDLGTTEGADALRARLNAAVTQVEGPVDVRDLKAESICQRDHRKAMQIADAMIAAYRTKLAMEGTWRLDLG
jgi:UrcA family protein